jgi:alpha-1,3-glucan synthase
MWHRQQHSLTLVQLVGQFITTFVLPGIPLLLWGEEQAFHVIDSTAKNYNFGRQSMSSSPAWQIHGCYRMGVTTYRNFPLEKALNGCHNEWNSLDHRDPTAPLRLVTKHMYFCE